LISNFALKIRYSELVGKKINLTLTGSRAVRDPDGGGGGCGAETEKEKEKKKL
jgi:hypothetical protein